MSAIVIAEEFQAVTSGYRLEIERLQAEVSEYLLRPLPVMDRHGQMRIR